MELSADPRSDEDDDEGRAETNQQAKHKKMDSLLTRFVVKAALPFLAVEQLDFKKLLKLADRSYDVPSRKTISGKLLTDEYNSIKHIISQELHQAEHVAITFDIWTSCQQYPYIGVTGHFLDKSLKFCSRALNVKHLPGSHTQEVIGTIT